MELLPSLQTGKLIVVCAPQAARQESAVLCAELARRGPLTVLDGGNRFAAYQVARGLRGGTLEVSAAAKRIFIRRAFTCYELKTLLSETPALRQPYLVLDLLNSFYDAHVTAREASRLLDLCLGELARLQVGAPVVVTLAPPLAAERAFLLERVLALAAEVFTPAIPSARACQPALF